MKHSPSFYILDNDSGFVPLAISKDFKVKTEGQLLIILQASKINKWIKKINNIRHTSNQGTEVLTGFYIIDHYLFLNQRYIISQRK